jgi:hypothetical protein
MEQHWTARNKTASYSRSHPDLLFGDGAIAEARECGGVRIIARRVGYGSALRSPGKPVIDIAGVDPTPRDLARAAHSRDVLRYFLLGPERVSVGQHQAARARKSCQRVYQLKPINCTILGIFRNFGGQVTAPLSHAIARERKVANYSPSS